MTAPFIFIGTHKIKDGRLEDFKKECLKVAEFAEANEPRLIGFELYADEGNGEVSVVQVHPDPESMLFHMQLLQERIGHAVDEYLDSSTIQIYGTLTDEVRRMIDHLGGSGVPITVQSPFGGFDRFPEL